jgi:hypothetical protein
MRGTPPPPSSAAKIVRAFLAPSSSEGEIG